MPDNILNTEILNVLEIVNGTPVQIESWVIAEDSSNIKQAAIREAEDFMIKCIAGTGVIELSQDEIDLILEEGHYDDDNGHEVFLIWSN